MIRPFHLRDAPFVARFQQVGVPLDVEEQLTHPRSPLRSVLTNSIFSPRSGPSTFILDHKDELDRSFGKAPVNGGTHSPGEDQRIGLAQMRNRSGRPEQDVVFISPALTQGDGSHAIWQRLLTHLCIQTAEWGNLRLYAGLPIESEELHLFKNVGFIEYSQEDIFQLSPNPSFRGVADGPQLRPQQSSDGWGLQKLYGMLTPRGVQNIEGLAQGQWALPKKRWADQGRRAGYVWEEKGEILGAIYLRAGHKGCWMRTLLHPAASDEAEAFGQAALGLVRHINVPTYFAVRTYEAGWRPILADLGFTAYTSQILMVKSMAVRVRNKKGLLLPNLEQSPPEGVTTAQTNTELLPTKSALPKG